MTHNDTVAVYTCVKEHASKYPILLALMASPIHILMLKILIQRLRLRYPRHVILLSLSISDNIQLLVVALLHIFSIVLGLETNSMACQVTRGIIDKVAVVTFFASTGSIIGLSFERYIACVHCFRVHQLVTDNKVKRLLLCVWAFGVILGFGDPESYRSNLTQNVLNQTVPRRMIYAITVIITTIVLLSVQIRLYLLSLKKMKVNPVCSSRVTQKAEALNTRKRQWKLNIVASAVVAMFVICMCPISFYDISNNFRDTKESSSIKTVVVLLAMLNTLADPFVYGFGMADTRKAIKKELVAIKNCIPFLQSTNEVSPNELRLSGRNTATSACNTK